MNIVLWAVQIVLALLSLSGGFYKTFKFDQVANMTWYHALPPGGWRAVGVLEIICGILLIAPAALHRARALTPIAALVLVVESLALAVLYARSSMSLGAGNPLPWSVVMALLAAFVAYGRYAR